VGCCDGNYAFQYERDTYGHYGKVFINRDTGRGNQLNDKYTVSHNKMFEGVLNREFAGLVHFVNTPPHK
jgi:hypothetical protein